MIVRDLSGKEHRINIYSYSQKPTFNKSSYHLEARKLLKKMFPTQPIIEELHIPGEKLYIDFFLPLTRLAVEVHGEQHYEHNNHFHKTDLDFWNGVMRDRRKMDWCMLNKISLIELPFNEDLDEWRNRITAR